MPPPGWTFTSNVATWTSGTDSTHTHVLWRRRASFHQLRKAWAPQLVPLLSLCPGTVATVLLSAPHSSLCRHDWPQWLAVFSETTRPHGVRPPPEEHRGSQDTGAGWHQAYSEHAWAQMRGEERVGLEWPPRAPLCSAPGDEGPPSNDPPRRGDQDHACLFLRRPQSHVLPGGPRGPCSAATTQPAPHSAVTPMGVLELTLTTSFRENWEPCAKMCPFIAIRAQPS